MSAELIAERQKTHGEWAVSSAIAARLKQVIDQGPRWRDLSFGQREALEQICTKIARIVAGDPNHADHWRDIGGYADLGIEFDPEADATGSYDDAIKAIGARLKVGGVLPEDSPYRPANGGKVEE